MALFVVLHHRRDGDQPWVNRWIDSDRLHAITTTADIAARCSLAKRRRERVYVHRCGWAGGQPSICCSVIVKDAGHDENIGWVEFREPVVLDVTPTFHPGRGENYYDALAPAPPAG